MKVWKVFNFAGLDWDLEKQLCELEASGAIIKEVIYIAGWEYKIIYTIEDVLEED